MIFKGCHPMPFTGDIFPFTEVKKYALDMIQALKQQSNLENTEYFIPLSNLENALAQFFEIGEKLEAEPELLKSTNSDFTNISELGDYGLQLISGLEQWIDAANEDKNNIQISTLSLAVWIHDHKGILQQLENSVNALSQLANQANEPKALIKLHKYAEKITNSAHEMIKADFDKSEPGRPWRILNLNHGIIATRTHNIDIMNTVFEQLLQRLPDDAANFFADGMKQMELIGYPDHVRHVMEQFYKLTNKPTLH